MRSPLVERIKDILTSHPDAEVHIRLVNGAHTILLRLAPHRVAASTALLVDLKAVPGAAAVTT